MSTHLDRVLDLWSLDRDELCTDDLFWRRAPDGSWTFFVLCNDVFGPASDAEAITEEDIGDLESAVADLRALGTCDEHWAPILWIARKRKRKPWRLEHRDWPKEVKALLDAVDTDTTP
jgi:hypothetical protein